MKIILTGRRRLRFGPISNRQSSAFAANLNSGRKVVVVLALSLAVAGGTYLWATKRQGNVSAEGGD